MLDFERVIDLEKKVQRLEEKVQELLLTNLQAIVLMRSLIIENDLKHNVQSSEKAVDVYEEYGRLFDRIYASLKDITEAGP